MNKEKEEIFNKVREYYHKFHDQKNNGVPVSGKVYDEKEMVSLVDSALDFWLTSGRFATKFEKEFAKFLNVKYCSLVNSGSSANLLAMTALTSELLGDKRLVDGDEVITVAAAFPTTVAPIIQNGLIPVFVDVELGTYNIKEGIENAISDKTKAIFIAHTMGNPFNIREVSRLVEKYGLWLIEDSCDALGSTYDGMYTGSIGHIGTFSFYPAHTLVMGEGGAVVTNDTTLKKIMDSLRDWGRDCWCGTGHDGSCGKRFTQQHGDLPVGYDHKYVYSHLGYNLKITDMQAAVGVEQLKKLPSFIELRKRNFNLLYNGLKKYEKYFILPRTEKYSDPSWFGFLLTVKDDAGFNRNNIVRYLENNRISTRMLFAGNILKQPCFKNVNYRVHGDLKNTDTIMNNTFWIGVYPKITPTDIEYILSIFNRFLNEHTR